MTDDELLALARKVLETKSSPEAIGRALLALREATRPTDIIALIERHSAEVAKLREELRVSEEEAEHFNRCAFIDVGANPPIAWKDRAAELSAEVERMTKRIAWLEGEARGNDTLVKELEAARKAEAERLTRERDNAKTELDMTRAAEFAERDRAEQAESAFAAERKRVGELEKTLQNIRTKAIAEDRSPTALRWLREDVRDLCSAALAGKEPGNGS